MACNQKDIKKFPWTVERSAALFRVARTDFVDKGITDFNKIVDGLSARYDLKREIVVEGLASPRGVSRKLTDDMWVKQQAARKVASAAQDAVREADQGKFLKGLNYAFESPRRVLLAGHFGAFTKSHLSDQAFYNPGIYARNFKDSWHLATKHGMAKHEQRLLKEFNPTDPDVKLALRSGLNVGEGGAGRFKNETKEVTGIKKLFKGPDRASMAYDELRISRMQVFRKEISRLSPEERADLDQVRALSSVINHDTGTTAVGNRIMRFMFLSPRLLPAQAKHSFVDIPKALFHTGFGFNYNNAAPAMRYVARKSAILAGAYTAGLAANTGVGLVTGDKDFTPNLGQEGVGKTSWLRPKLFGRTIPVSPTIELLKLPVQMIMAGAAARKGDNKTLVALTRGMRSIVGRQNPIWDLMQEAVFGQDVGSGRPTPSIPLPGGKRFYSLTGKTEETKGRKAMGWVEYAGTKIPIPAANYVREFYDEATSHGMPPKTAKDLISKLIAPTVEVATSYHLSPTHEPAPKAPKKSESDITFLN